MSKADKNAESKIIPEVSEVVSERGLQLPSRPQHDQANYPQHLATTARGVALTRQALAEASARALEAEALHRSNLERIHAEDRAVIAALRVEMYGAEVEQAMAEVEAQESEVWAEAELALEGEIDV